MSRQNVEIVRRIYEAAASRDGETVLSLYDAEVELDPSRLDLAWAPETTGGRYHGHNGLRAFFREWHEGWEQVIYDYDELIDAGENQVISVVTRRGRGRASGVDVDVHVSLLWIVRDGRVVRVTWFRGKDDALAAAEGG